MLIMSWHCMPVRQAGEDPGTGFIRRRWRRLLITRAPGNQNTEHIKKAAPILAPVGRGISRGGAGLLFWKKKRPPALHICQSLYPVAKLRGIRLPIKGAAWYATAPPP